MEGNCAQKYVGIKEDSLLIQLSKVKRMLPYIFLFTLMSMLVELHGQTLIVPDSIAKKLGVKIAVKKTHTGESKTPFMTYTEFYDSNGKLTLRTSFNNILNSISIKELCFYDIHGKLIEKKIIHYSLKDTLIRNQKYVYNTKGQLVDNFEGKVKYKYDMKGRIVEKSVLEKTNKQGEYKTVSRFDTLGRIISTEEYLYKVKQKKMIYAYNKKGQVIKEISSYYESQKSTPDLEYENTFIYDENGLILTEYQKQNLTPPGTKVEDRIYTYEYSFY